MDRVFNHPQIKPRNMVVEVKHPTAEKLKLIGIPVKYSETPGSVRLPPPLLGQHTQEILSDLLSYSQEEIELFRHERVI
jgi:crotonobetainyl-CoA:carnitine CoA-transferase CaiB-like acyl-CoA transferase